MHSFFFSTLNPTHPPTILSPQADMRLAALYDERLVAAPEHRAMGAALRDAFAATVAGVLSITGHARLSDGNPTLRHLIGMRGPHVDPLNVSSAASRGRNSQPTDRSLTDHCPN